VADSKRRVRKKRLPGILQTPATRSKVPKMQPCHNVVTRGSKMASVRKRGKAWQVQIRRTGFPLVTASFASKADALRWARNEEGKIDLADPTTPTLQAVSTADLLQRYQDTVSVKKRGSEREAGIIRRFLGAPIGQLSLGRLTSAAVVAYRDDRLKDVKPATVRRELALLRHCLEVARREWGIGPSRNPFIDVKMPFVDNSRDRRLEADEVDAFWGAVCHSGSWYLKPLVELAIETGMRRGELLGLRWGNIDQTKRLVVLPITKNGRPRRVPLTRRAAQIFAELPRQNEIVFPIKSPAFRQAWDRMIRRSGIENLTFHDLRHEAISRFFERGLSVPEVAVISGHRDYRMLFRYTHIRAEDVVQKLDIRE
jgi:integrase